MLLSRGILDLAAKPGRPKSINSGKWMLFIPPMYVDQTWNKVKTLLCSDKLGIECMHVLATLIFV